MIIYCQVNVDKPYYCLPSSFKYAFSKETAVRDFSSALSLFDSKILPFDFKIKQMLICQKVEKSSYK